LRYSNHLALKVSQGLFSCASWLYIKLIVMTLQLERNCAMVSDLGERKLSNASVLALDSNVLPDGRMDGRTEGSETLKSREVFIGAI